MVIMTIMTSIIRTLLRIEEQYKNTIRMCMSYTSGIPQNPKDL